MVLLGAVAGISLPSLARAQVVDDVTRRAARSLGESGVQAYQAGNYAVASEKLDKAYRTLKAPSLGLWSARALVQVNRLIEGAERYQEVVRLEIAGGDPAVQRSAKADAASELALLGPKIPNLVVNVDGASADDVTVTVDGSPLVSSLIGENRPTNPGKHHVHATHAGKALDADVELALGETKPVTLHFQTASAASGAATQQPRSVARASSDDLTGTGSAQRTVGFVVASVGAAGVVFGGVAAGIALSKKGTLKDSGECEGSLCLRSQQPTVDSYSRWRTLSSVGLIGGAALAVSGVVLVLSAPSGSAQTGLWLGPGSVAFSRSF